MSTASATVWEQMDSTKWAEPCIGIRMLINQEGRGNHLSPKTYLKTSNAWRGTLRTEETEPRIRIPVSPFHLLHIGRDAEVKYPVGTNCNWTHGIHKETYPLLREFAVVLCNQVQLSHCILLGHMGFLDSLKSQPKTVETSGMKKHREGNDRRIQNVGSGLL